MVDEVYMLSVFEESVGYRSVLSLERWADSLGPAPPLQGNSSSFLLILQSSDPPTKWREAGPVSGFQTVLWGFWKLQGRVLGFHKGRLGGRGNGPLCCFLHLQSGSTYILSFSKYFWGPLCVPGLPALGAFFLRCSLSQVRFILASGMCRQSTCGNTWGSSSVQPAHLAFGVLTVPRLFRPFSPLPVLLCLGEGPLPGPEGGLVPSTGKWIVWGDTHADKARNLTEKGRLGGEQQRKET